VVDCGVRRVVSFVRLNRLGNGGRVPRQVRRAQWQSVLRVRLSRRHGDSGVVAGRASPDELRRSLKMKIVLRAGGILFLIVGLI